jgi:putative ABC-type transport system, permease component
MPEWLQTLTVINPLRHAIVALRAIYFENAGFADLVPSLIPIVLAGMLSLAWASWLFRHKIQ